MNTTFFANSRHTQINGGQFTVNNVNQYATSLEGQALDLLRKYCALGAFLDSNERFDPPRCTAETREALIEETLAWIYGGGDSASIAWLFGGAGAGKSALAQTIAEICQKEGKLAGSFFFSRTSTADRSDGRRLIPTLVLQLLENFPDLKPYIVETIQQHVALFERSPKAHMDLLFIKPLRALKQHTLSTQKSPASSRPPTPTLPPSSKSTPSKSISRLDSLPKTTGRIERNTDREPGPTNILLPQSNTIASIPTECFDQSRSRLIVIDGLDECNGEDVQTDLLRVLASALPHLPFPLRFLIASRPEGSITRTINYDDTFRDLDVWKIDLSSDTDAEDDIRKFLTKGFQDIHRTHPLRSFLDPSWPSKDAVTTLVQKSSSHFVYASTAIKYVQYPRGRPDERLEIILGLSVPPTTDRPFVQLDALYTHIFMCIDEADRTTINHVLGLVHLCGQDDYNDLRGISKLEGCMGMRAGEINLLFEPLLSLVAISENREDMIKVLHASLFDFLLDRTRSGSLQLDLEMAHGFMAKHWFQQLQTYSFDKYQLEPPGKKDRYAHPLMTFRQFIYHCRLGYLSDEFKDYLYSCSFLYDFILHPKFIPDYMVGKIFRGLTFIFSALQNFYYLVIEKNSDNGLRLHSVHTTQIEQQIQMIHGDFDSRLEDATQEPLFNDVLYQGRHRVYSAFLNVYVSFHDIASLDDMLRQCLYMQGPEVTKGVILSHLLVICLPYLSSESCIRLQDSKWTGYTRTSNDELHHVLRQRILDYLQRVGKDLDEYGLENIKEAWGIE